MLAALFLPKGFALAAFGDALQVGLVAAATLLAFQNFLHSRARAANLLVSDFYRVPSLWTVSNGIWAIYEVWFARPVPDVPVVDVLLFVKVVPLDGGHRDCARSGAGRTISAPLGFWMCSS